jgi:hypothetical protein
MKNNYDDIILKYFSGLLNEKEAENFETEIEINTELKNRYGELRKKFADIRDLNPKEANPGYFINLIPEVREKLDNRSGMGISFSLQKALGFAMALVLLIFVLVQNGEDTVNLDSETVLSTLEKTDNEELNEFVELRYGDDQLYDVMGDIDLDNYSDALNEQLAVNTEDLYNYTEYAFYGLDGISEITENQENDIFSSLIDKKIL